jgi:riboflavin kinase/FMN adenylyltransferase
MHLVRGLRALRERDRGAVVTIGTFDGLHIGHGALIRATLARARREARPAAMVTFEPMPREVLRPDAPPERLTSFRERWRLLERSGLDLLIVLQFSPTLRALPGAQFLALLRDALQFNGVVVGHDFRYGRNGDSDVKALEAAGRTQGFTVEVVPPVLIGGQRASSTAVRRALGESQFAVAQQLLGRPYGIRGRVARGEQLGRTLGFPTANLRLRRRRTPLAGIFAVWVHGVADQPWPGVASLGTRPTVGGVEPWLETHLFDFNGDLYGREIEVEFVTRLRDEAKFESLDALVEQMHRDAADARVALAAAPRAAAY